ncbi:MAG: hypothetical protein ABSC23_16445 [Bryobacteraceae bacterium]|jgi:hypothetical protein
MAHRSKYSEHAGAQGPAGEATWTAHLHGNAAVVLAILTIFGFYSATETNSYPMWSGGDGAMYIAHARNLATGRPYRDTGYIFRIENYLEGGATYPSGYSLLLAPAYRLFGLNYRALKIYTDGILALSLAAIYLFARRFISGLESLLLVVFLGLGWFYLSEKGALDAEGAYQASSYIALWAIYRIYDRRWNSERPFATGLPLGVLLCFVYLTRSIGVAMILAVLAYDLARNRRLTRFAASTIASFAPLAILANLYWHHDTSYGPQLSWRISTWIGNILSYPSDSTYIWINGLGGDPGKATRLAASGITSLLAALGFARTLKRGAGPAEWYLLFYAGVLMVYHTSTQRYLLPVMPIYLVYAVEGLRIVAGFASARMMRRLRYLAAAAMLLTMAGESTAAVRAVPWDNGATMPTFVDACRYARTKTAPNSVFIFWHPRLFALLAERKCARYVDGTPAEAVAFLDSVSPDYVVFQKENELDLVWLRPVMERYPDRFQAVYANADFEVDRFVSSDVMHRGRGGP